MIERVITRLTPLEMARLKFMVKYLDKEGHIEEPEMSSAIRFCMGHTFAAVCQATGLDPTTIEKALILEDAEAAGVETDELIVDAAKPEAAAVSNPVQPDAPRPDENWKDAVEFQGEGADTPAIETPLDKRKASKEKP